jgi:hypothetical protein
MQPRPRPKLKKQSFAKSHVAELSAKNTRGPTRSRAPAATKLKKQTFAESHMARLSTKNPSSPRAKLSPKIIFIEFYFKNSKQIQKFAKT